MLIYTCNFRRAFYNSLKSKIYFSIYPLEIKRYHIFSNMTTAIETVLDTIT